MKCIDDILAKTLNKTVSDLAPLEANVIQKYISGDVTRSEMKALEAIYTLRATKENNMVKISRYANVTAGTMTTCINKLITKGLVKRLNTDDKRMTMVDLTPAGKQTYLEYVCLNQKILEVICEDLTNSEKLILNKLLEKILYIYENI